MVLPEVDVSALEHSPYDMEADRIPYPDPGRLVGHHVTRKVSLEQTYGECHALVGATQGVGNRELCTGELHRSTAVTRSTTQVRRSLVCGDRSLVGDGPSLCHCERVGRTES